MQVKIDTKEKFHAITISESNLAANMTADLEQCLLPILEKEVKNVVLILKDTQNLQLFDSYKQFFGKGPSDSIAMFLMIEAATRKNESVNLQGVLVVGREAIERCIDSLMMDAGSAQL